MHREEGDQLSRCLDCGAWISPGTDRAFAFGAGGILCWRCATERGGSYDADLDHWETEPGIEDLQRREAEYP